MLARIPRPRRRDKTGDEPDLAAVPTIPRQHRGKRLMAVAAAAVVVTVLASVALVMGGTDAPEAGTDTALSFATVKRTDLVAVQSLDGEVASKEGPDVLGHLNGTITWLPAEGTKVDRGQPLFAVDGLPVVLFFGSTPAFRDFGGTMTGDDVRQLEENLEALGFSTGTVDTTFTSTTVSAVKSWQDSLGLPEDGVVELGRIVFAPSALTVSEHLKPVGSMAQSGVELMSTESSERVVTVTLQDGDDIAAGDTVSIVMADNVRVPGKVTSVDSPQGGAADDGGTSTTATVVTDDANALAELTDGSDVDVELVESERRNVLVVPVTALLARRSGGYAVEVRQDDGRTSIVAVEPGLYADDLVEITGDVKEGDEVVVP